MEYENENGRYEGVQPHSFPNLAMLQHQAIKVPKVDVHFIQTSNVTTAIAVLRLDQQSAKPAMVADAIEAPPQMDAWTLGKTLAILRT